MSPFVKYSSRALLLLFGAASLSLSAVAAGPHPKFAVDLDATRSSVGQVAVIVQYAKAPDSGAEGRLTNLGAQVSGRIQQKGISAVVPSSSLDSIEKDPTVTHISVDHALGARGSSTTPASIATNAEYTAEPIDAPQVWSQGYYGASIGVAVIDSGINESNDLTNPNSYATTYGGAYAQQYAGTGTTRIVYSQSLCRIRPAPPPTRLATGLTLPA